ncbi:MAG TPA: DUF1566 domain-containing protein [Methylococcaceae bacterium]|nr:DUF1566 domain-containing protein [Methylococcaceae bacterium]
MILRPERIAFLACLALHQPGAAGAELNDTGIATCSNETQNGLPCPVNGYPGQDAEYGRDATHNDDSDGRAGFSFTKLDGNGQALSAGAASWSCVRDNVTGLEWEVKTDDGGLRDKDNTYTWYNPDSASNGGSAGTANGGSCTGSNCDTQAYVQAVNAAGLCGHADWRLPEREELRSLVDYSVAYPGPTIDQNYFPNTRNTVFSSASPYAGVSTYAWLVSFDFGYDYPAGKFSALGVRVVRGGQ